MKNDVILRDHQKRAAMLIKEDIGKAVPSSLYVLSFLYACSYGLYAFTPVQDLASRVTISAILVAVLAYPAIKAYRAKKLFWIFAVTLSVLFSFLTSFNILLQGKYDTPESEVSSSALFFSVISFLASYAFYNSKTNKLAKEKKSQIARDHKGSLIHFDAFMNYLVVNTDKRNILIGNIVNTALELSCEEILVPGAKILQADLDIDDDSVMKTKSSQGNAILGAIAFGAAGAIVGSLGTKTTVERKFIKSIDLKLILDDPKKQFVRINLFKAKKGRGELVKSKAMIKERRRIDEIYSSVVMIMKTGTQA